MKKSVSVLLILVMIMSLCIGCGNTNIAQQNTEVEASTETATPRIMKNSSIVILVLSGVIVSGLMSSIMGIIKFIADADTALAEMTYWAMGSVADVTMKDIKMIAPTIFISGTILLLIRYRLNVLSLGENEAKTLGINTNRIKRVIILCATVLTASAVCMAGTVGWVGLVIPHLARMLVGAPFYFYLLIKQRMTIK